MINIVIPAEEIFPCLVKVDGFVKPDAMLSVALTDATLAAEALEGVAAQLRTAGAREPAFAPSGGTQ